MEWKDIAGVVGKAAPFLGTLLGGPAGAAVGSLVSAALGVTEGTPDAVSAALQANPAIAVNLAQIESEQKIELQKLVTAQAQAEITAVSQTNSDINATMRAEAASEHWPTYAWRPAIGFAVALAIALSVLTVFAAYMMSALWHNSDGLQQLPGILASVAGIVGVASPILGIASWFRGKMQADPNIPTINRG